MVVAMANNGYVLYSYPLSGRDVGIWCPSETASPFHALDCHIPSVLCESQFQHSGIEFLQHRHRSSAQPDANLAPRCRMPLSAPPPAATSLPPPPNYLENGRTYHGFRRGKYMFPCDEVRLPDSAVILIHVAGESIRDLS